MGGSRPIWKKFRFRFFSFGLFPKHETWSMFESQNKTVCDICSHDDLTNYDSVKSLGLFHYDQFSLGNDSMTKSEPNTKTK